MVAQWSQEPVNTCQNLENAFYFGIVSPVYFSVPLIAFGMSRLVERPSTNSKSSSFISLEETTSFPCLLMTTSDGFMT